MTGTSNINFKKVSFKNFENPLNSFEKADTFMEFTEYMETHGHMN